VFLIFVPVRALFAVPGAHFLLNDDKREIDFGFTMMHGLVKEYVYIYDESYLLSLLDWDVAPLHGLTFGYSRKFDKRIFSASLMVAIPGRSGLMKDYDWAEMEGGEYTGNGVWTHYSEHPNYIERAFRLDLDWIYNWRHGEKWRLNYLIGFTWQHLSFCSYDGFYQYFYPPTVEPIEVKGQVVSYTTDQFLPVFGLMYSRLCSNDFAISSLLKLGLIGFQLAYDQHHMRDLDFIDFYLFQPYIEVRQSFALDFGKSIASELTFFLLWYPKAYGYSYLKDLSDGQLYKLLSTGAASSYFIGGEVSLRFSFGKR